MQESSSMPLPRWEVWLQHKKAAHASFNQGWFKCGHCEPPWILHTDVGHQSVLKPALSATTIWTVQFSLSYSSQQECVWMLVSVPWIEADSFCITCFYQSKNVTILNWVIAKWWMMHWERHWNCPESINQYFRWCRLKGKDVDRKPLLG